MIYSIHEGLFDRFKKKDKKEDKSVKVYHYITGKDFNDAKSTFTGCTVIESISNYLYIHNVNYSNKTVIIPDNNKSILNISFIIYKVPFDKCSGNKYLYKFNGSKEDAIEVFNGTLDEYIKKNNLKIKYFTPLFKDINECKSVIKRILNVLNTEFKNIKGAGVYKFQDLDEYDIKQFFESESFNEDIFIGSMDASQSEYDDKDNTFYELIDAAIERANEKIKNTGLYIDQDWDKCEGFVYLCYEDPISESTIFSEVRFMNEGFILNYFKNEKKKSDDKIAQIRKEYLEKQRKDNEDKEYNKIPKEERSKIDKILLDIFNKMEAHVKSKCSGKGSIWVAKYNERNNKFYRYLFVTDNVWTDKYEENDDRNGYIDDDNYEKFQKFIYKVAESFCKSNSFEITKSSYGTDNGYYYIIAKGKENSEYANIEFSMNWVEDSGADYDFTVEYKR